MMKSANQQTNDMWILPPNSGQGTLIPIQQNPPNIVISYEAVPVQKDVFQRSLPYFEVFGLCCVACLALAVVFSAWRSVLAAHEEFDDEEEGTEGEPTAEVQS